MTEKFKILKKDVPFLLKDIELDFEVMEKLTVAQKSYQEKFKEKIETGRRASLKTFLERIKILEETKQESIRRYDAEIQKYKQLLKSLKEQTDEFITEPKRNKTEKTGK